MESKLTYEDLAPSYEEAKARVDMRNEMYPAEMKLIKGLAIDGALGALGVLGGGIGGKAIGKGLAKDAAKREAKEAITDRTVLNRIKDEVEDFIRETNGYKGSGHLGELESKLMDDMDYLPNMKRRIDKAKSSPWANLEKDAIDDYENLYNFEKANFPPESVIKRYQNKISLTDEEREILEKYYELVGESEKHIDALANGKRFQYPSSIDGLEKSLSDKHTKWQIQDAAKKGGRAGRIGGTLLSFVPVVGSIKEYKDVVDSYGGKEAYKNRDKEATRQKYEEKIKEIRAANKAKKEGK